MRHRRTKTAALAIATGFLTAACTAPTGSTDAVVATPAPPVDTKATPAPAPAAPPQGALDEFTARIFGTPADQISLAQEQSDAEHRAIEELVAACMAEQGFTYYPSDAFAPTLVEREPPALSEREFAQLYGFGISVLPPVGSGQGFISAVGIPRGVDPNRALRDAMSDAEHAAWTVALWGEEVPRTSQHFIIARPTPGLRRVGEVRGCLGEAWDQWLPVEDLEFAAIEAEVVRFTDSLPVDPLMLALNREWATCMAGEGFPNLLSPFELRAALRTEWGEIQNSELAMELFEGWDFEADPGGPPDVRDVEAEGPFREREFALALADVDCRASLDFDSRQIEIGLELQQQFVAANRDELAAWATAAESHRADN